MATWWFEDAKPYATPGSGVIPPVADPGNLSYWTGTVWTEVELFHWTGAVWEELEPQVNYWDGAIWDT